METKSTLRTILKEWLTPSLIIGAIIGGSIFFGELKGLIFQTEEQRIKTKEHINTDISEVTLFRQTDTVKKRQDTLIRQQSIVIRQQMILDTLILNQNNLLDSIKIDNRKKKKQDSINEIRKVKSRNSRDYKMDLILEKIENIEKSNDTIN